MDTNYGCLGRKSKIDCLTLVDTLSNFDFLRLTFPLTYICAHSTTNKWYHRLKISNQTWRVKKGKRRRQEQVGLND